MSATSKSSKTVEFMGQLFEAEEDPMPENGPVCDFCGSEDVAWIYPTERTIAYIAQVGDRVSIGESLPGFVACSVCAELIERGDREGVAERSLNALPAEDRDVGEELAKELIQRIHLSFWDHRAGPRVPCGGRA
jgi:hypothetical protein